MTSLIDLSLAGPHQRVGKVAEARDLYLRSDELGFDPDYYPPVKEGFEEQLRTAAPPEWLEELLAAQGHDLAKVRNFLRCARGLASCIEKAHPEWRRKPVGASHRESGLLIRVNPELEVQLRNGRLMILKLYLKEPEATKARLAGPLYLLETTTRARRSPGVEVGILDARRGRIFAASRLPNTAGITLSSEIESFASIWDRLDARAA